MSGVRRTTVKVHGLRELQRALKQMPKAVAGNVLAKTLSEAGEPFARRATALAPVLTGALKASIVVGRAKKTRTSATVAIGPGPHPQGVFQEFGTAHHAAQPFMRPAWDAHKHRALDEIVRALRERIERTAAQLARRAKRR